MYARALFEAAQEADRVDAVAADLGALAAAIDEVPELRAFLRNPQIEPDGKADVLAQLAADGGRADRQLRPARGGEGPRGRDSGVQQGARRPRRAVAEPSCRGAHDVVRALRRGGAVDRADDREGLGPHGRGHSLRRPEPHRRDRPADRLAPRRRQRSRAPRAPAPRTRHSSIRRPLEAQTRRDHLDPQGSNPAVRRRDRPLGGRQRPPGRRRHRPRPRPRELRRARAARVRARRDRHRLQPRGGQRRSRALRRVAARHGGPAGAPHRRGHERPRRRRACSAASSTRSATRSTGSVRSRRRSAARSSSRHRASSSGSR